MFRWFFGVILVGVLSFFLSFSSFLAKEDLVSVTADSETDPVKSFFDAADDPAVWVHPTRPEKSLLLGSDKQRGIEVYNLNGKEVQSYKFGTIDNIDVRYQFPLGGKSIDIVGGSNLLENTIDLWSISLKGELKKINGSTIKPDIQIYGFAFYHSQRTGKYYALVTGFGCEVEQYELYDNGKGKVNGKKVRTITLSSKAEGVVADDEYGWLYIAEEKGGVWKYQAEPDASSQGTRIGYAGDGILVGDIEGMGIYYTADGGGYLLVSSQGDSTYAIYQRTGNNSFIGKFEIATGDEIDGASDTDGIDVIGFGLGPKYPYGLFIAQDGINWDGILLRNQNFKVVSWVKIANAFGLVVDNTVDPRELIPREP